MISYTQLPKQKEIYDIKVLIDEITDLYSDFYITRNNLRLMIRDNKDLFVDCLKKGDRIVWNDEDGILFITGFSDKAKRIYVKPLIKSENSGDRLIKVLNWNLPEISLWAKVKKTSPMKKIFLQNNYRFIADRGKEVLLCRQALTEQKDKGAENHDSSNKD